MNLFRSLLGAALMSGAVGSVPAQTTTAGTNASQAEALEMLRRVIAEQQRNPGKIIRSPTNTPLVRPSAPAEPTKTSTAPRPDRAELERQFLQGKITAKQFQRALADLEKYPPASPAPGAPSPNAAAAATAATAKPVPAPAKAAATAPGVEIKPTSPRSTTGNAAATAATSTKPTAPANPGTAAPAVHPDDEPEQKTLTDVEAKIDEILARRAALQHAAQTNAASTNAVSAGPMTKRQKLDALLRELIQGKITEPEYNSQREKVIAGPE